MPEAETPARYQASLPGLCMLDEEIGRLADAGAEERGAIFTRVEVVDFMLDLVGYTVDRPLHKLRILEPSFGDGDFLLVLIERLLTSWRKHAEGPRDFTDLMDCIRAVELHRASVASTHAKVVAVLIRKGADTEVAVQLAGTWLISGDFLMTSLDPVFDLVIGNPPYIRQESIPDVLLSEYRRRYRTIYDRADLYVAFIERSLDLLQKGGALAFICADRWMKNRYGGPLRQMVAERFNLRTYIDMVGTNAFHTEVSAYPAITVIAREKAGPTRVARRPAIERKALHALSKTLVAERTPPVGDTVKEVPGVALGAEPWILENFDQLAVVRRLEANFPVIEDAGCKVGIGVATGADKAYIGLYDELDVESSRKLPLAMTRDIGSGTTEWRGYGIVNPFEDTGKLINLDEYPRTKRYLEARKDQIAGRHVAKKAPARWYRTIDRITPSLAARPKLLIPDIKGEAHIVYEDGELYPHHNLYFIVSDEWNLKALRAVLLSGIARLFVATYSTQMRGGFLRFQAQYLRRIRVPRWEDVPEDLRADLINAAEADDAKRCMTLTARLYGLSKEELAVVNGKPD